MAQDEYSKFLVKFRFNLMVLVKMSDGKTGNHFVTVK